jgi:hypothetical protein
VSGILGKCPWQCEVSTHHGLGSDNRESRIISKDDLNAALAAEEAHSNLDATISFQEELDPDIKDMKPREGKKALMDQLLGPLPSSTTATTVKSKKKATKKDPSGPASELSMSSAEKEAPAKPKCKQVPGMSKRFAELDQLHTRLDVRRSEQTSDIQAGLGDAPVSLLC